MKKKLLGIGVALGIIGIILLVATIYQQKLSPPEDEDYHMGIPSTGTYEWRSHNIGITSVGAIFTAIGICFSLLAIIKRDGSQK